MDDEPLTDEQALQIRRNIIDKLAKKNTSLREQIDKLEAEIHLNQQIITQLRETTPLLSQSPELDPLRWKRIARKLQAGIERQDPSQKKRKI